MNREQHSDQSPLNGSNSLSPERTRSALRAVFLTILIDFMGFSVLIPVLPIWITDQWGATPLQAGGLPIALYGLSQLLFLPAWGLVSDRIGRRPVILLSLLGSTLSFCLLASADSLGMIYVARILGGFFAASIGTAQAVVTDLTPPEKRARGMGLLGAAFGLGFVLGNALGGLLASLHHMWPALGALAPGIVNERLPFFVVAALAACNLLFAWKRLPETRPPYKRAWEWRRLFSSFVPVPVRLIAAVHDRRIGLYLYLFFHFFTAFAALESMCALYLSERFGRGPQAAGLFFAYIGIFIALTQGILVGRLAQRFGEARLVVAGLSIMGLSLIGLAAAPSYGWIVAVGPLIAIGHGIAFPSFTSLYSQACAAEQSGELLGQSQSMGTTGRIAGPAWAGLAMGKISASAPFTIAGCLFLLGVLLFLSFRRTLLNTTRA